MLPAVVLFHAVACIGGRERVFETFSEVLCGAPGIVGVYLRQAFYRGCLPQCGENVHLCYATVLADPRARLGRNVYIGLFCVLGRVTLEDDVLVASHVSIINGGRLHGIEQVDVPIREQPGEMRRVTVGRGSWIGERAVVMADVGQHCVVGAGAVVTRPVPDYAVVAGVPARIVRFRNETDDVRSGEPKAGERRVAGGSSDLLSSLSSREV